MSGRRGTLESWRHRSDFFAGKEEEVKERHEEKARQVKTRDKPRETIYYLLALVPFQVPFLMEPGTRYGRKARH